MLVKGEGKKRQEIKTVSFDALLIRKFSYKYYYLTIDKSFHIFCSFDC